MTSPLRDEDSAEDEHADDIVSLLEENARLRGLVVKLTDMILKTSRIEADAASLTAARQSDMRSTALFRQAEGDCGRYFPIFAPRGAVLHQPVEMLADMGGLGRRVGQRDGAVEGFARLVGAAELHAAGRP